MTIKLPPLTGPALCDPAFDVLAAATKVNKFLSHEEIADLLFCVHEIVREFGHDAIDAARSLAAYGLSDDIGTDADTIADEFAARCEAIKQARLIYAK